MPASTSGRVKEKQKQSQKQKQPDVTTLPWTSIVQGQVSHLPIVFTRDAEFFFVTALSSVKIFSRVTGQLVSTLSSVQSTPTQKTWTGRQLCESHTAAITGLAINPNNSLQLLTSSLDGTIKVWDYLDATLLRTIDLEFPISHMLAHPSVKGSVYVALLKPKSNTSSASSIPVDPFFYPGRCNSIIQQVSLSTVSTKGGGATKSSNITRIGKARQTTAMALSPDGKYLVLIGKRKVHIAQTESLKDGFTKVISDQVLTCLAFHPENNTFATGDSIGQIRLWHFLDEGVKKNKTTKGLQVAPSVLMHWHAHAVSALNFSPNGANLLSGGEESVLVLWQLATQNREYVPRLGGSSLKSISTLESNQGQEEEYVVALADGSIAFVSAINLKPNRIISQVLIDSSRQMLDSDYLSNLSFPLAVQPKTGHLVMNAGHASSLQFFDVDADRLISQMEVTPSNRVSRPDEMPLISSRVDRVVFSSTGDWMATIESHGMAELILKVWKWEPRQKKYTLNSRIENPHTGGQVTSISFCPDARGKSPLLVTTGDDHQARTWRKVEQQIKGARKEEFWILRSTFNYRQLPTTDACWEPNGSLLAVSHDSCVTLWEPISNSLQQVIPTLGKSKGLLFAGKGGRYIVALSNCNVMVYDIVFGQICWEKEVEADFLTLEGEEKFSLLSQQRNWTVATSYLPQDNGQSTTQHQLALSLRQVCNDVRMFASAPGFFALTKEYDVVRVGSTPSQEALLPGHGPQSLRGVTIKRRTLYDELIGPRSQQDEVASLETGIRQISQQSSFIGISQSGRDLFDVASHLLPPVSTLYGSMIQQMLPKRQMTKTLTEKPDKEILPDEKVNDNDDELPDEILTRTSNGFNRLRLVSQMDCTILSDVFKRQASISVTATTPLSNGKAMRINGSNTSIHDAATTTTTPIKAKASPKKKPLSNGHSTTPSKGADLTESPSQTPKNTGRKRKQLVD